VRPSDTTDEARGVQLAAYRRMTPAQRAEIAVQMSEEARAVTEAGVRNRHPGWTAEQVRAEVSAILLSR
jgi:hypothetical protein